MNKIVVLAPDRDQYFEPIRPFLNFEMVYVREYNLDEVLANNPAVVVFVADWILPLEKIAISLQDRDIPTILLMDGTIEWEHLFENPKWSYGNNPSPFFPVICDKIFVPGYSTYRFLEFLGNRGKCEIVGQPRFDVYAAHSKIIVKSEEKILGIMSGNTPGYTDSQINNSVELFENIFEFCQDQGIKVAWRLRKGFHEKIKYPIVNDSSPSLGKFLEKVDAIICQPSTAAYEAMILGVPVALADYSIAPNYMTAAWFIHAKNQIEQVIQELFKPSDLKLILQKHILEETISSIGSSSMIAGGIINSLAKEYLAGNYNHLNSPKNLYQNYTPHTEIDFPESFFSRTTKFPEKFLNTEHQIKLEHNIEILKNRLRRRSIGFWIERFAEKISKNRRW